MELTRVTFNANAETVAAIQHLSASQPLSGILDISISETLRRSVAIHKYLDYEAGRGRIISTSDPARENVVLLELERPYPWLGDPE